jgi:hypothetical protein
MRISKLRCRLLTLVSIILFSCSSHVDELEECRGANLVDLKMEYFIGQWHSYSHNKIDLSTTTESCDFEFDGTYSCEVTEHGPMNKENTLFHADTYWENGKWSFENQKFHKNSNELSVHLTYDVKNATQQYFNIVKGEYINQTFFKNEPCAKPS